MTAKIISGNEVAKEIRAELKGRVTKLKERGITPGLVMVRVGEDPASVSYVSGKEKAAEEIGVWTQTIVLPENASEKELLAKVQEMNKAEHVDGILVQLPLPKHIDADKVLNLIDPERRGWLPSGQCGQAAHRRPLFHALHPARRQELLVRSGNPPKGSTWSSAAAAISWASP